MKISELPQEIKEKALEYAGHIKTDDLDVAFTWHNTKEGYDYWDEKANTNTKRANSIR